MRRQVLVLVRAANLIHREPVPHLVDLTVNPTVKGGYVTLDIFPCKVTPICIIYDVIFSNMFAASTAQSSGTPRRKAVAGLLREISTT